MRKAKLIVFEGTDNSGKETQTKLLKQVLEEKGVAVESLHFPRYDSFYGQIVDKYLRGELGEIEKTSPYLIAIIYALDRLEVKPQIEKWLKEGKLVTCDRYVPSNLAHQAARVHEEEREKFVSWAEELEYKINQMPKEDLVIYLYVPWQINPPVGADLKRRQEAEKIYFYLAKIKKNWVKIDCCQDGRMRPKEEIHKEILKVLREKSII